MLKIKTIGGDRVEEKSRQSYKNFWPVACKIGSEVCEKTAAFCLLIALFQNNEISFWGAVLFLMLSIYLSWFGDLF
ncbi:MAG: hypothetical protein LBO66_12280 [Deltaproteobacteria bacterium]|jgi:hypothetical protein|nr:hypothetical protein [Deltaproteobacteria bacterium]